MADDPIYELKEPLAKATAEVAALRGDEAKYRHLFETMTEADAAGSDGAPE